MPCSRTRDLQSASLHFFFILFLFILGLETVDRFPILGAVTGILLTLLMEGTIERFVSNSKSWSCPKCLKKLT